MDSIQTQTTSQSCDCDECIVQYLLNKKINPHTDRKIIKNGPAFLEPTEKTSQMCIEWDLLNRKKNPYTYRKIKKSGPTYKKLEKKCEPTFDFLFGEKNKPQTVRSYCLADDDTESEDVYLSVVSRINAQTQTEPKVPVYNDSIEDISYSDNKNYKNLQTRIKDANRVCRYLNNTVTISDQQWCISGPDKQTLNSYIESFQILANGTFGIVSKVMFKNLQTPVIIKEAKFMEQDTDLMTTKKIEGRFTLQKVGKKNYYSLENIILEAIDRLILQQRSSPNFLLFYESTWCQNCEMVVKDYIFAPGRCYLTFMEAADTDLYVTQIPSIYQQESVLYQVLLGLHSLQKNLGLWHRDIKTDNIFLKMIQPGGVLKYNVDNATYYVKNEGFIAYLSDFNVADCLKPGVLTKQYDDVFNKKKVVHPVQVTYINNQAVGIPLENKYNKRRKWINSKNVEVSLSPNPKSENEMRADPIQFPAKNFFGDVQDVIRMFTGGKRSIIDQLQLTVQPELPEMYTRLMSAQAYVKKMPRVTSRCVKYLLAKEMLKTLYKPPPKNSGKFYIIDEFTL